VKTGHLSSVFCYLKPDTFPVLTPETWLTVESKWSDTVLAIRRLGKAESY
jgi:hypothetical protein